MIWLLVLKVKTVPCNITKALTRHKPLMLHTKIKTNARRKSWHDRNRELFMYQCFDFFAFVKNLLWKNIVKAPALLNKFVCFEISALTLPVQWVKKRIKFQNKEISSRSYIVFILVRINGHGFLPLMQYTPSIYFSWIVTDFNRFAWSALLHMHIWVSQT